jgi:hypothetical protein
VKADFPNPPRIEPQLAAAAALPLAYAKRGVVDPEAMRPSGGMWAATYPAFVSTLAWPALLFVLFPLGFFACVPIALCCMVWAYRLSAKLARWQFLLQQCGPDEQPPTTLNRLARVTWRLQILIFLLQITGIFLGYIMFVFLL